MKYEIQTLSLSVPRPTAVVRRRCSLQELPRVIPEACGIVWSYIRSQQVPGAGENLALYLDDEINVEVGIEINGPFTESAEVVASSLPVGRVATTVHIGPYQRLGEAHMAVRDWCISQGITRAGPSWEIYGHWQEAWNNDPSQIRTDVFYLLA